MYLIDFGIARHFKPGQAKDTLPLGSPGYAAPEQYGKAQTTPHSDVYSLGATLHKLLSGKNPEDNPFMFDPLNFGTDPKQAPLEKLIFQMLEIDSKKRPASAKDIKTELQRIAALQQNPPQLHIQQPPAPSGTTIEIYCGHFGSVCSLAWSPDGTKIVSGSIDKTAKVWDVKTGRLLIDYKGYSGKMASVAWSPDGKYIASSTESNDSRVHVWDAATGNPRTFYTGHSNIVISVAWSPDGHYIASGSADKTVHVWVAPK